MMPLKIRSLPVPVAVLLVSLTSQAFGQQPAGATTSTRPASTLHSLFLGISVEKHSAKDAKEVLAEKHWSLLREEGDITAWSGTYPDGSAGGLVLSVTQNAKIASVIAVIPPAEVAEWRVAIRAEYGDEWGHCRTKEPLPGDKLEPASATNTAERTWWRLNEEIIVLDNFENHHTSIAKIHRASPRLRNFCGIIPAIDMTENAEKLLQENGFKRVEGETRQIYRGKLNSRDVTVFLDAFPDSDKVGSVRVRYGAKPSPVETNLFDQTTQREAARVFSDWDEILRSRYGSPISDDLVEDPEQTKVWESDEIGTCLVLRRWRVDETELWIVELSYSSWEYASLILNDPGKLQPDAHKF